jgi:putative nucleotidyltransferase with HDIG domain
VRVLRLANSAFYGARGQVSRIDDAVQMLGLRTVASTLAAVSLRATLGAVRCDGFQFDAYWRHTLCTALSSRELARQASLDPGEAFLLGLLHDVGKLILAMTSPALQTQALRLCQAEGVSAHEAELRVFGVSHAEVGAAVVRQWNFPETIAQTIAHHHQPLDITPASGVNPSNLVHMANRLAHGLEDAASSSQGVMSDPMWSVLGTSDAHFRRLTERVSGELDALSCV